MSRLEVLWWCMHCGAGRGQTLDRLLGLVTCRTGLRIKGDIFKLVSVGNEFSSQ